MAPSNKLKLVNQNSYAFMTCILKVYTSNLGWQKTVMKVLNNIHGVYNFRMDEDGIVEVSGKVTPTLLLKLLGKAGKHAEVLWWQFGECSSNLFLPACYRNDMQYAGYGKHGYYGGYGSSSYYGGDHFIGHGDHGYHGGYGGTNYYANNSCSGYGDHGYSGGYGGTSCYGGAPAKPLYNPFLGSTRGSVASSRQAHTIHAVPGDCEGSPTCCAMM